MPQTHGPRLAPGVAYLREEDEPCQRGTVGCCVDHKGERDDTCETW